MAEDGNTFERVLTKKDLFVLAFGAMIGWGWIIQTGVWIDEAGVAGSVLGFVAGAIMVGVVGLIYGELTSAMPFVGGEHVYSFRALGPLWSFVCTWSLVLGYVGVVVFEVVALPSAMAYIVPGFNVFELWSVAGEPVYASWILVGGIGAIVMTALNYRGVKPAAQFQTLLTVIIALAGVMLVVGALFNGETQGHPPLSDVGAAGVASVAIMTPFMFVGFDVIPQSAEEADVSPRLIGLLIPAAVSLAAVFYIAVIWGSGQAMPGAELAESNLPAATAMEAIFSSQLIGRIMALAGIAGILTSWNSFLLGASRAVFALADSGMIPRRINTLHPEYNTPSTAVALIGGLSVFAPLFGEQMLVWIVNASSLGLVVAWFLVAISFLVLRYREPNLNRPLKLPFGYAFGAAGLVLTLGFIGLYLPGGPSALVWPYEWAIVLLWALLGVVLYSVSSTDSDLELADLELEELE
ncbi:APC family permease [Natrinema versiforme]|uniref:Cationic amino acid transporter n=1 Tax=Natrinema versiforme JCM 10478 TaxID=1227496 RepID=L9Y0L1_9EURY|nr:APC family permease [Natrinema versiforme]ELY67555.1 cationic amino acid transporter [Natrinema versiforme JCM 10478]